MDNNLDRHDKVWDAYYGFLGPIFMRNTQKRINWVCSEVSGKIIFDIGCSSGVAPILLGREGKNVVGIDSDTLSIEEANTHLSQEAPFVQERVQFVHADFLAYEGLTDQKFDTIIISEVLEHLVRPSDMMAKAVKYLVNGGKIVITVPFGINDFIDHKQTFYLSGPYQLLSAYASDIHIEYLGSYIGLVGIYDTQVQSSLSKMSSILEDLEKAFFNIERAIRDDLADQKKKVQDLTKKHKQATEQVKGLNQTISLRDKQLAILKKEVQSFQEEVISKDTLTQEIKNIQDNLVQKEEEKKRIINEYKTKLKETTKTIARKEEQIKKHLSYRLGNVLVRYGGRFWLWPILPVALYKAYRSYYADKKISVMISAKTATSSIKTVVSSASDVTLPANKQAAGSVEKQNLSLIDIYSRDGADALLKTLNEYANGKKPKEKAVELLKIGKSFTDAGIDDIEILLASEALKYDQSEGTYRGYFWAAQRAKKFEEACQTILKIETILGKAPSEDQQKRLQQLKSSPAWQLSILEYVQAKHSCVFEPVLNRVCYILHNSLPYSSGGYATRSHGVALGLRGQGFDVIAITRPGFPFDIKPELVGQELAQIDNVEGMAYHRIFDPVRQNKSALEYMILAADALETKFLELRPMYVIAASNHVTGLPALIAARRLGIPFIYEVRGLWEITRMSRDNAFEESPSFVIQTLLEAAVCKHADHVFTLTEPMREELVSRGVDVSKISLLPNSCDPERFVPHGRDEALASRLGIPNGIPVIGYIGTFVDYEGLEDLASGCAILKQRGIEFRLMLVGNENASGQDRGPITEQIAAISEQEGFSDWLIMPGRVPHEEVEAYYSLIDIAPFPRKPWPVCEMVSPMKPLEALAMEKAVVVSSVRALVEMIQDHKTGLVFEKGNVISMADTLERLIKDTSLRAELGRNGRVWVENERTWTSIGHKAGLILKRIVLS